MGGSRCQNAENLPASFQQPPKIQTLASCPLFNARISHISMTITTSKNQIFIIVHHLPVDLYKGVLLHALQTKAPPPHFHGYISSLKVLFVTVVSVVN